MVASHLHGPCSSEDEAGSSPSSGLVGVGALEPLLGDGRPPTQRVPDVPQASQVAAPALCSNPQIFSPAGGRVLLFSLLLLLPPVFPSSISAPLMAISLTPPPVSSPSAL